MSSGCGDVLSLEDLKTAKKHQIFEAEVITGKAGGVASGADIDYATNKVTGQVQKTLPAVLRDAGFRPASFTFTTGGSLTVNDADLAVLWPIADGGDGNYYVWKGALPKTIPAGSNPGGTGGVSSGAWQPIGDVTLRDSLSSANGSSLIGHQTSQPAPYNENLTVKGAIDRLNSNIVYASLYGVKADGVTDDTAALQALSVAVSSMTNPVVHVIFPQGTSIVGAQQQAPNSTSGYSFRPTYESTGGFGWFYVNFRSGKTIINAYGYKIKLKDGLKHGSFNPITGAVFNPTMPFYDNNYQATVGHCATFRGNEDITVLGLECDGSASSLNWGGEYGDIGWQCVSFGIYAAGNEIQYYEDVECHDAATDAWYFSTAAGWTPPTSGKRDTAMMVRCIGRDSRRQGITIAGGGHIKLDQCQFYSIGRYAQGAGSYYSAPEACLDIESESGSVYDFVANDCQFIDGRSTILAASFINPAYRAHFTNCLMRTDSDTAQITTTLSDMFFDNCVIEGSGIDCRDTSSRWETSFRSCSFSNFIGSTVAQFCTYVGNYGVVEDCTWDLILDSKITNNLLFAMLGGDLSSTPAYPQKGAFRFNRINLKGNQDLATAGGNGRIALGYMQFFYDMDFRVTASGLTGTKLLQFDNGASFVNQRGITCDSPKVVHSNLGTSIAMLNGGYMLPSVMSIAATSLSPQVDKTMTIGTPSIGCANIYIGQGYGVVVKSTNGTAWKLVVSDTGVVSAITP